MTGIAFSIITYFMAFYCFCNGPKEGGYILMGFSIVWYLLGIIGSHFSEKTQLMKTYIGNKKEEIVNELDR